MKILTTNYYELRFLKNIISEIDIPNDSYLQHIWWFGLLMYHNCDRPWEGSIYYIYGWMFLGVRGSASDRRPPPGVMILFTCDPEHIWESWHNICYRTLGYQYQSYHGLTGLHICINVGICVIWAWSGPIRCTDTGVSRVVLAVAWVVVQYWFSEWSSGRSCWRSYSKLPNTVIS